MLFGAGLGRGTAAPAEAGGPVINALLLPARNCKGREILASVLHTASLLPQLQTFFLPPLAAHRSAGSKGHPTFTKEAPK